jgi:hypothetical protein
MSLPSETVTSIILGCGPVPQKCRIADCNAFAFHRMREIFPAEIDGVSLGNAAEGVENRGGRSLAQSRDYRQRGWMTCAAGRPVHKRVRSQETTSDPCGAHWLSAGGCILSSLGGLSCARLHSCFV